jgi:hypothetical protein
MEPMRLLVTDAAAQPPRQATAWLIMTLGRNMKIIGYWHDADSLRGAHYPHPKDFVDSSWLPGERHLLLNYLRAEYSLMKSWGYSWCRFGCGIPDSAMGSQDYSDGEWVWPHGLPHYVEHHDIFLPDEFVDKARSQNWICTPLRGRDVEIRKLELDDSFWIEWTQKIIRNKK